MSTAKKTAGASTPSSRPAGLAPAGKKVPAKKAPPPAGYTAEVNQYLAAYIMGVANRLANGASNYYRKRFNMGMSEWRTMMAIGSSTHRIVREVAEMADLDNAAASKSLKLLGARGLVAIEQTNRRGRAAIASLTPEGKEVHKKLKAAAKKRQIRLLDGFEPHEVEMLWSLLKKIEKQVPAMNADG